MRRRLIALLMAALMGIGMAGMNVYAADGDPNLTISVERDAEAIVFERPLGDGLYWTLEADGDLLIGGESSVYYGSAEEGESPFSEYKDQIKHVLIQNDVGYIGDDWFKDCANLESIQFGVSVTKIGKRAFRGCTSLQEIEIPAEVTEIKYGTFSGCTSMTEVIFPGVDVLTSIGDYAFSGCTSLTGIEIPKTVRSIGMQAFRDCSSLTEINIPDSMGPSGIGVMAFIGCTSLEKITCECSPDYYSVKDGMLISYFTDDYGYSSVELEVCVAGLTGELSVPENVKVIASQAFRNSPGLQKIIIPAKVNEILDVPFYGAEHIELEVDPQNTTYASYDGVIYDKDMTTMLYCAGGKNGTVTVPAGVTTIGDHACAYSGLQNIVIPDSLTTIEGDAFRDCTKITAFTFPESLTEVGMTAFQGCTSLDTIRVLGGYSTKFYREVFLGCTNLKTMLFEADMPSFSMSTFEGVTATAYYNYYDYYDSWYDVAYYPNDCQYGGTITWEKKCFNHEYCDWYELSGTGIKERACIKCGHKEQMEIPIAGKTGWQKVDGCWYYFNDDGTMAVNKWVKDSKGWCYLGADGKMVTNDWVKDSKGYCWIASDGYMPVANKWIKYDGGWYYIEKGYRVQNAWRKDSKGWCYLGADGRMVTNDWVKDSKGYCWIASDGYMPVATKWIEYDGGWYHITNGYRDQNKWMKDSKGWCWLQSDGRMLTNGWAKDSKGWCWIASNGYMPVATQWIEYDGNWYHITNGYRDQNKWVKKDAKWCYVGSDGTMVTSTWKKDSKGWCYLDADGFMVANGWAKDSKGNCWIGPDGYMEEETKVFVYEGETYGIENGYMVINGSIVVDGVTYTFDENGKLVE